MPDVHSRFPGTYRDVHGTEDIEILNDGRTLRVVVRGVTLTGEDFDDLKPVEGTEAAALARLPVNLGWLWDCELRCRIPLRISGPEGAFTAPLETRLILGDPTASGQPDEEVVQLRLVLEGQEYLSPGVSGWYEDELNDLFGKLPEAFQPRLCFTCAFSDYNPGGHGLFGGMACFRDNKAEYLTVRSKGDMWRVWPTLTEYVQETHLCPEFQQRPPGTGYRG